MSSAPFIGEIDRYLFGLGTHYEIYKKLGAHITTIDGVAGTHFAVWAPNAQSVSVVGNFNDWNPQAGKMELYEDSGIYALFVPGVGQGEVYKYFIVSRAGEEIYKTDPYGKYAEVRPANASIVFNDYDYTWKDTEWMQLRSEKDRDELRKRPMAIYECHPGSWRKNASDTDDGFYNYRQLAHELGKYLKDMKYTHVELMGIAEYPFDGSWGYQVTGYYAPTSRYGTPDDFKYFIDYMHKLGISVILDWVPAHFPRDAHGLARFDGTPLYECADPRRGEHPDWGTYIFDYGKNQVSNFLIANVLYWANEFHIDGFRVDAVASMLYLDYGKQDGAWLPNPDGSNENRDAIEFFRHLHSIVNEHAKGVYIVAEESTAWAGVTAPVDFGGLGFTFKWNMGWMNDFLDYMKTDPYFRGGNHNKLCFSMMYAYSENFVQVLSHDEVVHGKASMIYKMPGDNDQKFANLRTAYGFMYGHPGKKLLFMGQEFAQTKEWNEAVSLDWDLLKFPEHEGMRKFVKKLNSLYNKYDAFYYNDYDPIGFEWMSCDDTTNCVVSFVRRGSTDKKQLLFICNFAPIHHPSYVIPVSCKGRYNPILNSDDVEFGGQGIVEKKVLSAKKDKKSGTYSLDIELAPLSVRVFSYNYSE